MASNVSNEKQIEVQGLVYDSLSAAARAFGLNSDKVLERVRCGWNIYEALEIVERKLPTMNYQDRIKQFAAQEKIKPGSVGKRLSLRRRRIREWLNLPSHSPTRHSNALIVTDSEGRTFGSLKEASAEKGRTDDTSTRETLPTQSKREGNAEKNDEDPFLNWWFLKHVPNLPENILVEAQSLYERTTLK